MIEAKIICDSISPEGIRLTTMQLRYPRMVHSELMTHRVFSRNASSSRAVPTKKMIEEVRSAERATPVFWGKNQPGMRADEELTGNDQMLASMIWNQAAYEAAYNAERMLELGVHKGVVNRILEPFLHINTIISGTEWDNFFGLRLHKDAQPEMRALAEQMWAAREASKPKLLQPGQWHLPYVDESESSMMIKVSVARCARVSYLSFDTGRRSSIEEDLKLYERLVGSQPMHASPAEHQATPDRFVRAWGRWNVPEQHGNFHGWRQYRKMLIGEAVAPLPSTINP